MIDLTGAPDDDGRHMFDAASLDRVTMLPSLDRVAMHAIAVHRTGTGGDTLAQRPLRPAADEVLAEVTRVVAQSAPTSSH